MSRALLAMLLVGLLGCGPSTHESPATAGSETTEPEGVSESAAEGVTESVRAAVAASDRTEDDRALDSQRRPDLVFSFFGIEPGQSVADLFAGGGYTSELLARIVGPSGHVIIQNNHFVLDRFARAPLETRLSRLAMPNVVPVELEFDAPLPADAHDLDAVIFILAYHDTIWQGADRAAMNRAIFEALRPGGSYGVVDHSAAPGHGIEDVQTLHRIEESVVREEILAAGFVLDGELDALRNPEDTFDWSASPSAAGERRGTSDRFVLRFIRPRE